MNDLVFFSETGSIWLLFVHILRFLNETTYLQLQFFSLASLLFPYLLGDRNTELNSASCRWRQWTLCRTSSVGCARSRRPASTLEPSHARDASHSSAELATTSPSYRSARTTTGKWGCCNNQHIIHTEVQKQLLIREDVVTLTPSYRQECQNNY